MEVYNQIKSDVRWVVGIIIVLSVIFNFSNVAVDSTDKDGFNRSGVSLVTDYGTGLEYLYRGGSLIPRLDVNGKHKSIR